MAGGWRGKHKDSMPDVYLRESQLLALGVQERCFQFLRRGGDTVSASKAVSLAECTVPPSSVARLTWTEQKIWWSPAQPCREDLSSDSDTCTIESDQDIQEDWESFLGDEYQDSCVVESLALTRRSGKYHWVLPEDPFQEWAETQEPGEAEVPSRVPLRRSHRSRLHVVNACRWPSSGTPLSLSSQEQKHATGVSHPTTHLISVTASAPSFPRASGAA